MTGSEMREIRRRLRMDRVQFAKLIGYTGTDNNNANRVKRHENAGDPVPLYLAKLLYLMELWVRRTGDLPTFPDWPGYVYDHSPDPMPDERDTDATIGLEQLWRDGEIGDTTLIRSLVFGGMDPASASLRLSKLREEKGCSTPESPKADHSTGSRYTTGYRR